ncbi:hypothetical protein EXIGLDRAFT_831178 [Exidia glandulosa HHB12029]|uniref:Terpene synthase n=1 Tax=Exidia glandulosa HHB12029 TaxID=1314781 RepID=A0A165MUL6_EXIGL|nr:hypothetical protein EXIGLDRAFT_831178 [Exidia glandulosa HHB12029]
MDMILKSKLALYRTVRLPAQMLSPTSEPAGSERIVYRLPDNLRIWPWPRRINPLYEQAKAESIAWIRELHAFSPKAQNAFEKGDFARLGALVEPDASYDVLRVTCDLMQLVFVFDDYTDRGCADEVRVMADAMMDGLRQPDGPKPHMLGTMMKQFWQRVMPLASPGVQSRFIAHFQDWVDSVVEQALDRDSARSRNVEEYMAVRRLTIGAYFAFVLHQLGQQVPDESAFDSPVIRRLETLAAEMIILANDAYSYNVEQARGDTHNVLAVVRDQYNWSLDRALQWLAEQHDELVADFLATIDSVPPELAKYVDGLGNWVRANDAWSFESQRYFGKGGLGVMSKREVILLPKQDLLVSNAEGLALFHPVESSLGVHGGSVGDCGYIRDGKFHKLYSIFGPPSDLNIPAVPRPDDLRRTTHPTGNFTMQSSRSCSFTINGGVPFTLPPVVVDANISVGHKAESVAFLTFGGRTHEVDEWDETNKLQDYLVRYYEAILEHYKSTPVADYGLILLFKTKKAKAWCGGVASKVSNSITAKLEVDVGGVSVDPSVTSEGEAPSNLAAMGGWPFAMTSGPVHPETGEVAHSSSFPYTVVVSPVLVRWYDKVRMKIYGLRNAARSSSNTQQGDQTEGSSREIAASRDPEATEQGSSSIATFVVRQQALQAGQDTAGYDEHDDAYDDIHDEPEPESVAQAHEENTLLGAILDAILNAHSTAKVAVGDWNAITTFVKEYAKLPSIDCDMHIRLGSGLRDQTVTVAYLIRIEPSSRTALVDDAPCVLHIEHTLDHVALGWEHWRSWRFADANESENVMPPTPAEYWQDWDPVRSLQAQLSGSRVTIGALTTQLDAYNDHMQQLEDEITDLQQSSNVRDDAGAGTAGPETEQSMEAQGQSTSEGTMPDAQSVPAEPESVTIAKLRQHMASLAEELTARESELSALRSRYEGKGKGRLEAERGADAGRSSLTSGGSRGHLGFAGLESPQLVITPPEDSDPDSE